MRVLFISPTIYKTNGELIKQSRVWLPGLTLPYLAALTPKEFDIRLVDETTENIPFDEDWDIVGITSVGGSIFRAWEIADQFREQRTTVILGGISSSLSGYEMNKDHCDSFVVGEADSVWAKVLKDFKDNELKKVYFGERLDLKDVPVPRYDLLNPKKIGLWMPVQASRGCIYSCTFCSVASFYDSTYRKCTIENILKSVDAIKKLGYKNISFIDDSIGSNLSFLKELSKALISYKMKWMSQCTINIADHPDILDLMAQSGCTMLSIGIESVNEESLKSVNKTTNVSTKYSKQFSTIRSFGIDISTEMMMGLDGDDDSVFEKMYSFIMKNKISVPRIFIVTPVPGTPFHKEMLEQNRIFDHDSKNYNGSNLVFYPSGMTTEGLEKRYWKLYEKLFTWRAIFSRYLRSRPARGLITNLFVLGANFHYRKHIAQRIPPGIV